ncbi:MAG: hypothetical protein HKN92_00765 [Chitinophagales bacterium]|nr:hypothetical protein [Chitinophagales bacterium]
MFTSSQFAEFFQKLFDVADWPPRWVCGRWTEFHGWLYISSDVTIWLAYFVIPVILIWFVQKKPNVPFMPVFWLFGAFIILCGATHLIDAIIFWWPGYRLSALLRFITAIVSMATVYALIKEIPKMLEMKPPEDFSKERQKLKSAEKRWKKLLEERDNKIERLVEELSVIKDRA